MNHSFYLLLLSQKLIKQSALRISVSKGIANQAKIMHIRIFANAFDYK